MNLVDIVLVLVRLLKNVLVRYRDQGRLTLEEKAEILQTVLFLAKRAAILANSLESSMCHGYSTNTWKQKAQSPINSDIRGIQVASRSDLD
jgi:hypothetical protein